MDPYIERPQYMAWLRRWEGKETVKVVSGVRRCGKSTLLRMFCDALVDEGVDPRRIISLNMEDIALDALSDYRALYDHIVQRLVPDCRNYVVIDEIQQVPHFEKVVNSLRLNPACDIYITGSNAYLMASELATLLTGRYVELKMLPLSFAEFSSGSPVAGRGLSLEDAFGLYLSLGSFPYMMQLMDDAQTAREYLQDMFNSIMLKDVVQRLRITEVSLLQRVARVLASSVGSLVSPTKIANTITSNGQKTDVKTVDKYIDGLTGSLLFYEASRWDVRGRHALARQSKLYIVDPGLRRLLAASPASELGHVLENVVYLELLRRGFSVYVGVVEGGEIDFVAERGGEIRYFQVSASVMDEATRAREVAAFSKVRDNFDKTVLTLDRLGLGTTSEGIRIQNVLDWLCEEPR